MDFAQLALQGERDDALIKEALTKFDSDSSDEEADVNNFHLERKCFVDELFNKNSLCYLIKSRGYGDSLTYPLKAAIAIELKVTIIYYMVISCSRNTEINYYFCFSRTRMVNTMEIL